MDNAIIIRKPHKDEGAALWQAVRATPELDCNSCYSYHMICHHFSNTSVVAHTSNSMCGFVTGYFLPDAPGTLFIWQMGVAQEARGRGLALAMLIRLLTRDVCKKVSQIETTVSTANIPSQKVFEKVAGLLETGLTILPFLEPRHFPEPGHADETLIRIGPVTATHLNRLYVTGSRRKGA